tara:strand:+ start:24 stop:920 length:897 start_codon:yes stop_codon:yes gene_type:complete
MIFQSRLNIIKKSKEWDLLTTKSLGVVTKSLKKSNSIESFVKDLFVHYKISYPVKIVPLLLMSRFPNEIITNNRNDFENELYEKSIEIFKLLNHPTIDDFKNVAQKILTLYLRYEDWMTKDKTLQIDILCEIFYTYKKFYNDLGVNDFLQNNVTTFLNKILLYLKNLDNNWKESLSNYNFKNSEYDEDSHLNMLKYLRMVFWDNVKMEIFVRGNFKVINLLINDYLSLIEKGHTLVDITILDQYKEVTNEQDVKELAEIFLNINRSIDSNFNYSFNENDIISNFEICFNRLDNIFNTN